MRTGLAALLLVSACGSGMDGVQGVDALTQKSNIKHLVVIVQENHSFDAYFGRWCTAPAGSNPACTRGSGCCEAAPATDPSGHSPVALTDDENAAYDPTHARACELTEIDHGAMDGFVTSRVCGDRRNFALAGDEVAPYRALAARYALADRYFQPIAGQSSSNDMYFAVARKKFIDNAYEPRSIGSGCALNRSTVQYSDVTIADLLAASGNQLAWYAEGYQAMQDAWLCPAVPDGCTSGDYFPCIYDPGDVPQAYFAASADRPARMRDYAQLQRDLDAGTLPAVSFVKGLTYRNEHPGYGTTISNGVAFATSTVDAIESSRYAADTLVLIVWDESGGFFDHVSPPPASAVDGQPYGPRVPLIAVGPLAKQGYVSHVPMEHSSIIKFIEWNWIGKTGLLKARDAAVANLGDLIDPVAAGVAVPSN